MKTYSRSTGETSSVERRGGGSGQAGQLGNVPRANGQKRANYGFEANTRTSFENGAKQAEPNWRSNTGATGTCVNRVQLREEEASSGIAHAGTTNSGVNKCSISPSTSSTSSPDTKLSTPKWTKGDAEPYPDSPETYCKTENAKIAVFVGAGGI